MCDAFIVRAFSVGALWQTVDFIRLTVCIVEVRNFPFNVLLH